MSKNTVMRTKDVISWLNNNRPLSTDALETGVGRDTSGFIFLGSLTMHSLFQYYSDVNSGEMWIEGERTPQHSHFY